MSIHRLLVKAGAVCTSLVVLPLLAAVPMFAPSHYELPTVQAAQAAQNKCIAQHWGQDHVSTAGPDVVCFFAYIDAASAKNFLSLPIRDGSIVVLRSMGGSVEAALDMADVIVAKHLVAVVDAKCLSSCANYLFTAAAAKIVLDGGVVGFHGGPAAGGPLTISVIDASSKARAPTPEETARAVAVAGKENKNLLVRQARFFQEIGVNPDVLYHSPLKRYAAQFHFENSVWEYGADTLRDRFGVRNILYFQTPDRAGFFTRIRSYLSLLPCRVDSPDVYFCQTVF
jgi:hypothetical protein